MNEESTESPEIIEVPIEEIGEGFAALRLVQGRMNALMVQSIEKYGQLSPVIVGPEDQGGYELVDGFKRLFAFRELRRPVLKARVLQASRRAMKVAVIQLNWGHRSIGDLEEALVLRSLFREDGLRQNEIGALLGRHKSWVSRRISLIERLSEEIIDHIRLGLIKPSIGRELARLPCGNQNAALKTILKYHFNYREVFRLVSLVLIRPRWEYETILQFPQEILEDRQPPRPPKKSFSRTTADIPGTLEAMKTHAETLIQKADLEGFEAMTLEQRRHIFSLIDEMEEMLGELKKRWSDQDHDSDSY